jgi:hypothetical protein
MVIVKAERRASESKLEYEQVSKLVKTEVARFEQERIEDFKDSLHVFLEGISAGGTWFSTFVLVLLVLLFIYI